MKTETQTPITLTRDSMIEWTISSDVHKRQLRPFDFIRLDGSLPDCLSGRAIDAPIGYHLNGSTLRIEFKTSSAMNVFDVLDFEGNRYFVEKVETGGWLDPALTHVWARCESDEPKGFNFISQEIADWFHGTKKAA